MSPINLRVHVKPLGIQFLCVDDGPERLLHTLAVLMEVVDLDLNGRFIPRAEDIPDILFIADTLLMVSRSTASNTSSSTPRARSSSMEISESSTTS